jgi:hypothetical protein
MQAAAERRTAGLVSCAGRVRPRSQRCVVRVTYLNKGSRGQWKAHGRYLARESTRDDRDGAAAFSRDQEAVDVVRELERWQSSGGQRKWKVTCRPSSASESISNASLATWPSGSWLTLERISNGLRYRNYNTEHPHVHMVIRGMNCDGQLLYFDRDYVRHGIRGIAEDLCTRKLGYRTGLEAAEAERREIGEARFPSLDRLILLDAADAPHDAPYFTVATNRAGLNDSTRLNRIARLTGWNTSSESGCFRSAIFSIAILAGSAIGTRWSWQFFGWN